ncbi:hypothetical protein LSH36_575g02062 [Paralvinella palmiformis]|uniref:Uncharacterized protein n=1 Tax=Paralvinella palmiformis TaxID=53620 RepID=A0AAD9J5U7_9ANNE|nr:hypothetical protein LSH36_575g02062 [Paralvinella palmiformis]
MELRSWPSERTSERRRVSKGWSTITGDNRRDGLLCYRCKNAKTNEECNAETNLVDCEEESTVNTRYDTCRTRVVKTIQDGILYSKGCVVGPCSLDGKQDVALGLDCDRSYPEWDCEYCCREDRCNANGVESRMTSTPAVITCSLTAVVICWRTAVTWTIAE